MDGDGKGDSNQKCKQTGFSELHVYRPICGYFAGLIVVAVSSVRVRTPVA